MTGTDNTPATVQTTCPYCGVGCGVNAAPTATRGDKAHPANLGRLCVKGSALHETLTSEGRLLSPSIRGRKSGWPQAIAEVAQTIQDSVASHGPGSVAFYLSGQLLTEDYYAANKLAKGFIRTPHVDTNSRLCMSSAVAAHKRAFGEDLVPGCYEDLELADLLVLAGSNAAWAHPVLYQRMQASARPGRRVVVIDPRKTATSDLADLHLALRPGTDTVLFNGLLAWLADQNQIDRQYIDDHCQGFEGTLEAAKSAAPSIETVAHLCDLPIKEVATFYHWFAEESRTVTAFSQGMNQSSAGTDKGNAIINCHLATGRIGKPGASPFSLTGQPNAMGGREVGGLANTLAAHMDYDSQDARDRVARFWGTDAVAEGPGMKAVELFDAVERGEIKVLWIMATNPAVSLPETHRIRRALDRCPTVIVSDCVTDTDTTYHADILLPAAGWGEKDGTVTNSERCISRQRRFLPQAGEARPDWWIITEVARALGHGAAFDYKGPADVFREHARLSGYENTGQRFFDISGLAELSDDQYDSLAPRQWPINGSDSDSRRLFTDGRFATGNGRARLIPVNSRFPARTPTAAFPMIVNTGRIRDQWHTMTRTARASRLLSHRPEPFIEVHPEDIRALSLTPGALASLNGPQGSFVGRVRTAPEQRQGEVFVPIHWNNRYTGQGLATALIESVVDPISGQPEAKYGLAALTHWPAQWHGQLLVRRGHPKPRNADYWSYQRLDDCDSWTIAGLSSMDWKTAVADLLGGEPQLVMEDVSQGRFRAACLQNGQLQAVLMVDPNPNALPAMDWLASCFSQPELDEHTRRGLLSARAVDGDSAGNLICSCFQVGDRQIQQAVERGVDSVEALGEELQCGTNCGSCLPEIRSLLKSITEPV